MIFGWYITERNETMRYKASAMDTQKAKQQPRSWKKMFLL